MSKNLIPEVANLLGVETGEKFMIRQNKYIFEDSTFMFDKTNGLLHVLDDGNFDDANAVLYYVLSGKVEITKLPWEPQDNEAYWTIVFRGNGKPFAGRLFWNGDNTDFGMKSLGMVYRTQEEAEANLSKDYERLTGKPLSSR